MTPEDYPEYCNVTPMTSSNEQPPKENLYTKDTPPSVTEETARHREKGIISSRPHPAPVEPEGIPNFFGAPVLHGHFYSDKFMKKHDAAIIRKAREDVLQEIIRIAKTGECIHPEDGYCDGDRDCTECIAEHLWSTTPQSEQEQPR